jgi:hypothetical protein
MSILFHFYKTLHYRMLKLVKLQMNKCVSFSFLLFFLCDELYIGHFDHLFPV